MLKDFFHKLYDFLKRVLSSRIFALALVFTGMFLVLAAKLFDLQIVNGESYLEDYVQMIEKTVTTPGTRGNIYCRIRFWICFLFWRDKCFLYRLFR